MKVIDEYGFLQTSVDFKRRKLPAYKIMNGGNYTYIIFGDYEVGPIHRIDSSTSGVTVIEWSYGAVADRESLTYRPLSATMEIK